MGISSHRARVSAYVRHLLIKAAKKHLIEMIAFDFSPFESDHDHLDHQDVTDRLVEVCDRGNMRLIFRQSVSEALETIAIELGYIYEGVGSRAKDHVTLQYNLQDSDAGVKAWTPEESAHWEIKTVFNSPESQALLRELDPEAASNLDERSACFVTDDLNLAERTEPDSFFFQAFLEKMLARFSING